MQKCEKVTSPEREESVQFMLLERERDYRYFEGEEGGQLAH